MVLDAIGLQMYGAMEQVQEQAGAQVQKQQDGVIMLISSRKIAGNIHHQIIATQLQDVVGAQTHIHSPIVKLIGVQTAGHILLIQLVAQIITVFGMFQAEELVGA